MSIGTPTGYIGFAGKEKQEGFCGGSDFLLSIRATLCAGIGIGIRIGIGIPIGVGSGIGIEIGMRIGILE